MVIDLLEYEVRFGQGFLFAPPRPIRSEIFQTGPERPPLASSVQARREASSPPPATWPRANELPAQASPTPERNAQGLTQLARPIVRRA